MVHQIPQIVQIGGMAAKFSTDVECNAFLMAKAHFVVYNIQKAIDHGFTTPIAERINGNHIIEAIQWVAEKKKNLFSTCSLCSTWKNTLILDGLTNEEKLQAYQKHIKLLYDITDINPYTSKQVARGFPWLALRPEGYDGGVDWTFVKTIGSRKFTFPIWICAKIRFLTTFSSPCLAVWYMHHYPTQSEFWAEEITDLPNDQYAKRISPISDVVCEGSFGTLDFLLPVLIDKQPEKCNQHLQELLSVFTAGDHKDLFHVHEICSRMVHEQWKKKSMFSVEERQVIDDIETQLDLIGFNTWLSNAQGITLFQHKDSSVKLSMIAPTCLYPSEFAKAVEDASQFVFTWECVLTNMNCSFLESKFRMLALVVVFLVAMLLTL